jgi:hypothetical protein
MVDAFRGRLTAPESLDSVVLTSRFICGDRRSSGPDEKRSHPGHS